MRLKGMFPTFNSKAKEIDVYGRKNWPKVLPKDSIVLFLCIERIGGELKRKSFISTCGDIMHSKTGARFIISSLPPVLSGLRGACPARGFQRLGCSLAYFLGVSSDLIHGCFCPLGHRRKHINIQPLCY